MLQHLRSLYDGVSVKHSYAMGERIYDCVPIQQQASVRRLGLKTLAAPPPMAAALLTAPASKGDHPAVAGSQQSQTGADPFGNAQRCEDGSIPMLRVTLKEMSRFETLQKFFEKSPNGAGQAHQTQGGNLPPSQNGHSYAHEYQNVNNYGGYSVLSLYSPYVNTG